MEESKDLAPAIGPVKTPESASQGLPMVGQVTEPEVIVAAAPGQELPEDTADNEKAGDDVESQKAIFEQQIYQELHTRAHHLMDFVYKHKLTRAQLLVALMDRA